METSTRADILSRNGSSLLSGSIYLAHLVQISSFRFLNKSSRSSESRRRERVDPRQRDSIEPERANGEKLMAEPNRMAGNDPEQRHKDVSRSRVGDQQRLDRASHDGKRQTGHRR